MNTFRIALAQINTTVGDFEGNTTKIIQSVKRARELKVDLVAFPELTICGYPPEDLILKTHFVKENLRQLKRIRSVTRSISAIIGLVHRQKNKDYNAAAFLHNGRIIDIYHKIHLPNYGVFDEKRYFEAGTRCPVFSIGETTVGINICEDIWRVDGPHKIQTRQGQAKLIVNLSCSPYHQTKLADRERLLKTRARENQAFTAYVNLVGGQDELVFDGASLIFDPKGKLIGRGREFEEDFVVADLNITSGSSRRLARNVPGPELQEFKLRPIKHSGKRPKIKSVKSKKMPLLKEIYQALVLGTRDYIYKNGFKKVVLGLSGGIDSALVAAIAVDAIGAQNVIALIMPSQFSSDETRQDSETIIRNLGIEFKKIPIDDVLQSYRYQLRDHFLGRSEGVAEENLQARIRGNLLMFFSNKSGWLVLTTGNKSETGVGYCTLYGDMAGGFAVIKDVPKTLVYKLIDFYNKKMKNQVIPKSVSKRAPSAELRPNQRDEDSLSPYRTLDPILDAYVEKDKGLAEIIKKGFSGKTVREIIKLVDNNEYKRRQAPPGVRITPKSFGRDRRMPITNKYRE